MNIQIGDNHRITSDSMNIIVEELSKPKQEGGEARFYPIAYFTKLEHAIKYVLDRCISLSDAETLAEIQLDIQRFKTAIQESTAAYDNMRG